MTDSAVSVLTALPWLLLAAAHSLLGERFVLRPLFGQPSWRLGALGRGAAEALLRFAWHATTIAWIGLASLALGAPVPATLTLTALAGGLIGLVTLRWHLAWPVLLLGAGFTSWSQGWLEPALPVVTALTIAVVTALAALHVYWAFGGRAGAAEAVPTRPSGEPLFRPGPTVTFAVAALLVAFAILLFLTAFGELRSARIALALGTGVLLLRAVGDGRYVGFTKRVRQTRFGRLDDRLYTPTVVFLILGSLSALGA